VLRRLLSRGVAVTALGLRIGLVGAAACYDIPMPDCGFTCGPSADCPDGYTCAADKICHRNGTLPTHVCNATDAGVQADASTDAAIENLDGSSFDAP
jgi:hypothetical protein